ALIGIITTAVVIGSVKAKRKGLNLPAFILFGIGGICIGLDMIVMSYINSRLTIGWSLFVITPCVIIGVFFLYLHYRLAKKVDIKRKIQL
ncbi:MAG: hypothetical protein U9O98_00750, partial [Asgard group archaeon]|nr:hypothetical protein [Asgard group archaeon]